MTKNHCPDQNKSEVLSVSEQSVNNAQVNSDRRKILKKIAVGTIAVAGCSALPSKWTSPVVEFGVLPAHAVTSGEVEVQAELTTTSDSGTEEGTYWGRFNGNRPTWYYSKTMAEYPQQFTVVIEGCVIVEVTNNNGIRFESGDTIVKQSDVPGRGMAVIGAASCYSKTSYINY